MLINILPLTPSQSHKSNGVPAWPRRLQRAGLTLALLASLTLVTPTTQAATITVNTTTDEVIADGDLMGNITGASPNLGPLQNNGGLTFTQALLAGSPAIDAGNPAGCLDQTGLPLTTDQRGFIRPVDGDGNSVSVCDMGAYEDNPPGNSTPMTNWIYLPIIQK